MRNAVAIFLLCIGFFGCSFEKPEVAETTNEKVDTNVKSGTEETEEESLINFDKETFDRERTAWEAQNRNSYRYQITSISDPPVAPVRITVLPDVEPLIEYVSDHALLLGDDAGEVVRRHGNTITGLYAAMEADITTWLQKIAERLRENEEIKISIIYNETYHYPEYFISAIYYNGEQSTGGAYGFRINSFEVLTESGTEETEEVSLINFDKETFDRERTAWEAQNRGSYRYQITSITDIPVAPVRITVLPDVEPFIEYVSDHILFWGDDAGEVVRRHGNTITGLYAAMEADITRLQNEAERIREKEEIKIKISIIYNETYHYPEYFISDSYYNGEQSDGGAYGFRINSFEVLTEPHS